VNKHRDPRVLCNAEQPGPEPSHHGVLPLRSIVPISPVSFKCYLWPSVQSSGLTRLGHLPHLPRSQGSGNPFTPKQSSLPKANPLQMCRWPQLPLLCQTECICWAPSRLGVGEAAVVHLANLHFLALGKEHISVSTCPPPPIPVPWGSAAHPHSEVHSAPSRQAGCECGRGASLQSACPLSLLQGHLEGRPASQGGLGSHQPYLGHTGHRCSSRKPFGWTCQPRSWTDQ
jgi:hypothetical protein